MCSFSLRYEKDCKQEMTEFLVFVGLGGTCVNVGCIPKKLMHQAALLGKIGFLFSLCKCSV